MLFEQIAANKRKTIFIVLLFIVLILISGTAIGYAINGNVMLGAQISTIVAFIYVIVMILNSDSIVMATNKAKRIHFREEEPILWDTVEQMAMVARIPMPKVYIVYAKEINAFATGMSPKTGAIAVTSELLRRLEKYEIEAVIAHEISHIRNYDVRLATISLALVSAITLIAEFGQRLLFRQMANANILTDSKKAASTTVIYLMAFILVSLTPFVAVLLQLFLSRNREYLADASAVELMRNPQALIDALEKIRQQSSLSFSPEQIKTMKFSAVIPPLKQTIYFSAFEKEEKISAGWFDTHPPIALRIERLKRM
jgi:heat shock protein HtpX